MVGTRSHCFPVLSSKFIHVLLSTLTPPPSLGTPTPLSHHAIICLSPEISWNCGVLATCFFFSCLLRKLRAIVLGSSLAAYGCECGQMHFLEPFGLLNLKGWTLSPVCSGFAGGAEAASAPVVVTSFLSQFLKAVM